MYFESWSEFIHMSGHGVYVWSAYALAALVGIYNIVAPIQARRRALRDIRRTHLITTTTLGNKERSIEVVNESGS